MSKGVQIAIGAGIVALLLGWFGYTNLREGVGFQYYQSLDEFLSQESDWSGRRLRVHGYVATDSIERDLQAKNVRFSVQNDPPHAAAAGGRTLEVLYAGLDTPDMFKDGAEVVIEGRIEESPTETVFIAENVMAKCPSKFEGQGQRMGGGPDGEVNL